MKNCNDLWNYTGLYHKLYDYKHPYDNDYGDDDVKDFIVKMLSIKEQYYNIDLTEKKLIVSALNSTETKMLVDYIRRRPENPNPFLNSELDYNGHNRFRMNGDQSGQVSGIMFYNDSVMNGLNLKTFARYPNKINHTGYSNFTACKDMRLKYELNKENVDGDINIIINTHQLLRVMSGIGCAMW